MTKTNTSRGKNILPELEWRDKLARMIFAVHKGEMLGSDLIDEVVKHEKKIRNEMIKKLGELKEDWIEDNKEHNAYGNIRFGEGVISGLDQIISHLKGEE